MTLTDQLFHMRKINVKDVPEQERKSPKGNFGRFTKNISIALGREPESLDFRSDIRSISRSCGFRKANHFARIMLTRLNRSFIWFFRPGHCAR